MTTSCTCPSAGVATALATAAAMVSARKNRSASYVAALERDQLALHVGVGAAGIHRGDPQRRLALAQ